MIKNGSAGRILKTPEKSVRDTKVKFRTPFICPFRLNGKGRLVLSQEM